VSGPTSEQSRAELTISGRVQGVFYRVSAVEAAREIGVTGWVRNERDGRVSAVVEGARADVERLIAWCRQGPPAAHVTGVEVRWGPATGRFADFEARR